MLRGGRIAVRRLLHRTPSPSNKYRRVAEQHISLSSHGSLLKRRATKHSGWQAHLPRRSMSTLFVLFLLASTLLASVHNANVMLERFAHQNRNPPGCPNNSRGADPKQRLELLHITKTGGTALEILAAQHNVSWGACHFLVQTHGMPSGVSCPGSTRPKKSSLPGVPLWHAPPKYLKPEEKQFLKDSNLFTIVRNPYERAVSSYNHNHRGSQDAGAMNDWLTKRITNIFNGRPLNGSDWRPGYFGRGILVPQTDYIDKNVRILHLETIRQDFMCLAKEHGIDWEWQEKHRNGSGPGSLTTANLSHSTLRLIEKVYWRDFEELGYHMRNVTSKSDSGEGTPLVPDPKFQRQ